MPGTWDSLPVEIRLMILEDVARQRHPGWASSAAVSREWQAVLEPKNFSTLKLGLSSLEQLEHMVNRQAHVVRHIWLHIELPRYNCRCCPYAETNTCSCRHNTIARDAIVKLFSVLAAWKPGNRLVLEVSAYTPSDAEHWFHPRFFGSRAALYGLNRGQYAPIVEATHRLYSMFLHMPPVKLPEVPAVTDLVMRRQFRRHMHPAGVRRLVKSLPRLQSFVYEPWRHCDTRLKADRDIELAFMLRDIMNPDVKTISILEDFNEDVESTLVHGGAFLVHEDLRTRLELASAIAFRSCSLEHLSVSYMANARDFFEFCRPTYNWDRLQSLALTSPLLRPAGERRTIVDLLLAASRAALRMPKLEDLVLWNGKSRECCAFIYHKEKRSRGDEEGEASLTWRGTWDFDLDDVAESWKKVAPVQVRHERLQKDVIDSHGDAIHYLRLPRDVIDPESLRQIRGEGTLGGAAAFHGVTGEVPV